MQQRIPPYTIVRTARLPGWAAALGGFAALAIAGAVLAFSFVVLLVLAPILAGGFLYLRWKMNRMLRDAVARREATQREADARAGIIEGEFVVVEEERRRE